MSAYRDAVAGAISGDEVGSIFGKVARAVGKGAKGVAKGIGKGAKAVGKATGKAAKFAVKHPLYVVAPGVALHHLAAKKTAKVAKKAVRSLAGKSSPSGAATSNDAEGPVTDDDNTSPGGGAPPPPDDDDNNETQTENQTDDGGSDEDEGGSDEGEDSNAESDSDSDDNAEAADGESSGAMDEYIGLDEISGEEIGSEDVISGDGTGSPRRAAHGRLQPDPNAVVLKGKKWSKARRQPLGFVSSAAIATTASATVSQVVQTLFRGRKLVVGPAIASFFTIDNLFVGTQSQFGVIASQSAEAFLPTTTGEDNLTMDPASPGMTVSIAVTNIDTQSHTFRATIFGNSVQ
jgi:hypothetical protein